MGKVKNDWQDRDYVLKWFGDNSVLRPGKIGFCFLNTNDFEDLPHLR
jgi:hypothetical protein